MLLCAKCDSAYKIASQRVSLNSVPNYPYEFRFSKEESMDQQISLEFGKNMKMVLETWKTNFG